MNKTKFLAVLAIPALLAACSQDEFTEIATNQGVDLSNRKVLENVTLNFGDTDVLTRGTIGSSSYNSYKWTSEDGVGACIIDAPDGNGGYDFTDYISSNYKYYYTADSQWKTDALMVEGNYMFYSPYSEKHLVRSNIVAEVPTTQNVLVKTDDNNPIKEFYESGNTVFIGYKFLPAKDQPKVIDVAMRHIFAYPKFTLTNLYDTRTTAEIAAGKPAVYPDIKIVKIVLKTRGGDEFKVGFKANNENVAGSLKAADNGEGLAWDAVKHSTAATTDVLEVAKDGDGNDITAKEITINLGEGITLKGEESLSFHAVLPAAAYNDGIEAVAYDEKGNTYTVNSKVPRTGVTLNPGYRYPAQEYNNDGSLKKSAGELLTFKLTDKNAAPTDILDNDDFIAYLKSLSVRFNELKQIASNATAQNESEFKLNDNAAIVINTTLIDALANFNSTEGGITDGKVTFNNEATGATFAIGSDVTIKSAAYANDAVTLEVVSVNGAEYTVVLPAANAMTAAAGTYVISSGTVDVDEKQAAPTNIIITGNVNYDGANAKKISSLTVAESGELTLTGKTEGVQINVSEGATLKINANVLVTGKIVNNGTIENSGTMYAETNVNNGTITVVVDNSVTKAAAGKGTIVNTNLGAVKANAAQTVTWEGEISALNAEKTGLAVAGNAKYGINNVTITDADLSTGVTLALLKAPIKGCTVSTVTLSAATNLTLAEGGDMGGLTLVFDKTCTWTGDNFNAPTFTNATLRIADGETVSVSYATVSGKLDKNVTGYKTGKIGATDATGEVNF